MKSSDLIFERPPDLEARTTPEDRGIPRDGVRLLVTTPEVTHHVHFRDLSSFLDPGDLLVVNDSATLAASLPGSARPGNVLVNVSTQYGPDLWLVEPRWDAERPGPLPLEVGHRVQVGPVELRLVSPFPGLPRLWFAQMNDDMGRTMREFGRPIRYGYLRRDYPLETYQTIFARTPGSAEMPSAARPFTPEIVSALQDQGIRLAAVTLHAGVSSLEIEARRVEEQPPLPEPFAVPPSTAALVNATRGADRRVVAVGTTVVRALETAWDGTRVRAMQGFTRSFIHPNRGVHVVQALLTGLHDPVTTHLALLYTLHPPRRVRQAYREAVDRGYLWHEFGDSHLLLT